MPIFRLGDIVVPNETYLNNIKGSFSEGDYNEIKCFVMEIIAITCREELQTLYTVRLISPTDAQNKLLLLTSNNTNQWISPYLTLVDVKTLSKQNIKKVVNLMHV